MAQHVGDQLAAAGQATGDGHLGAVQHDGIRDAEPGADQTEREDRVEDDQIGIDPPCRLPDAPDQRRSGHQHRGRDPLDADTPLGLVPVEGTAPRGGSWR